MPWIVVIGAGIIGALVAREIIAAWPSARLCVVDRDLAGLGASERSAGIHFCVGKTERVREMARYSEDYYAAWKDTDRSLPIQPIALCAVVPRAAAQSLRAKFALANDVVTPAQGIEKFLQQPNDFVFWDVPGSHCADVGGVVRHVMRSLRKQVDLFEGVAVATISETADGVEVRMSTGETLQVDKVVLAPGPWIAAAGWRDLLAPLGLRVKKIVAFHIETPPFAEQLAMLFPEEDAFIAPLQARGHWLFSYTCPEWDVDPDRLGTGISADNRGEAQRILGRYATRPGPKLQAGRVFCDAYSPSREPVVEAVSDRGHVIFAGGANGSGYRLAPAIARDVTRLMSASHYASSLSESRMPVSGQG